MCRLGHDGTRRSQHNGWVTREDGGNSRLRLERSARSGGPPEEPEEREHQKLDKYVPGMMNFLKGGNPHWFFLIF